MFVDTIADPFRQLIIGHHSRGLINLRLGIRVHDDNGPLLCCTYYSPFLACWLLILTPLSVSRLATCYTRDMNEVVYCFEERLFLIDSV